MKPLNFLVLLTSLAISQLTLAHSHSSDTFKTTALTDSLTLLQGKGGNIIFSQGEDGLLIIDNDYYCIL